MRQKLRVILVQIITYKQKHLQVDFFFSDLDSETIPLFLGATAGMRILEEYNATIANILFENVQLEIESFELWKITSDGIRTITGNEGKNCSFRDANSTLQKIRMRYQIDSLEKQHFQICHILCIYKNPKLLFPFFASQTRAFIREKIK